MKTAVALKEWRVITEALLSGDQILLIRKGGIRDSEGAFHLEHREFLLYPTLEHQRPEMIREEFRARFGEAFQAPGNPNEVVFQVYAGVALSEPVKDPSRLEGLERYHVWKPEFFRERGRYRPGAPLCAVVVRAYRLNSPAVRPVFPEYAGCKSWIPLRDAVSVEGAQPVMENRRFRAALEEVASKLGV